jgi:hypothetical protein
MHITSTIEEHDSLVIAYHKVGNLKYLNDKQNGFFYNAYNLFDCLHDCNASGIQISKLQHYLHNQDVYDYSKKYKKPDYSGNAFVLPEFIEKPKDFTLGDVLSRAFSLSIYVHYRNHVKSMNNDFIPNTSFLFITQ